MWTFLGGMATGIVFTLLMLGLGVYIMIKRLKPELQKLASVPPPLPQQKTAYQLKLKNLAGESLNLESLKGKVIFLNFWGTMCGPCVAEMPSIQKLYDAGKFN